MIEHIALGKSRFARAKALWRKINTGELTVGGNKRLKIYGKLNCKAGRKMKPENRVFFRDETEADALGYRPCALCMREQYLLWKKGV